jgi:hypothetical protein
MRPKGALLIGLMAGTLNMTTADATERYFTYTYEPEVFPQGAAEFEQWVTLRTQKNVNEGQKVDNFNLWELREEFEYGVTDNYSMSLYLNTSAESFRDTVTGDDHSEFRFDGVSVENRYMVLNPAEHPVGLTLYLEPRFAGDEAEVETKVILGQRVGDWKWAFNLTHATEWLDNLHTTEGEVEANMGVTRRLNRRWSVGFELRDHNELPDYHFWENTAISIGPVATYTEEKWWATLTVLPQVYGNNFQGNPDNNRWLDLEGHERLDVRLIVGIGL